jgi:hypothetical protein
VPITKVFLYRESNGNVPLEKWLDEVERRDLRIGMKCRAWLGLLGQDGRDLRRPIADYLRDGIYELRVHFGHTNYRMLYFFTNEPCPSAVVVSHGLIKEDQVPDRDIDLAIARRDQVRKNWEEHTYGAQDGGCSGDA